MIKMRFFQAVLRLLVVFAFFFFGVSPAFAVENGRVVHGYFSVVVTPSPESTKAAYDVLKRGGTAADAAVTALLVLGLVKPQLSGIGGGAAALYYDARSGMLRSFDGLVKAPEASGKYLFRGRNGKSMDVRIASLGGRAVGVPGALSMLEMIHKDHGRLAWRDLFTAPVYMAERGFIASEELAEDIREDGGNLKRHTAARLYFYPDGVAPLGSGEVVRNRHYASVLRNIAIRGSKAFYTGDVARDIVKEVREAKYNPGLLSVEDMGGYKARTRPPLCVGYRGYMVCSMEEPSAAGVQILQALGILENFDLKSMGKNSPRGRHLMIEAVRLAKADSDFYVADHDFVKTPGRALIDRDYLRLRASSIDTGHRAKDVWRGLPAGWDDKGRQQSPSDSGVQERADIAGGYIHIIDGYGNAISLGNSLGGLFGAYLMAGGVVLNSSLVGFSFTPEKDGKAVANRVEGGKKPVSMLAPVMVFNRKGTPVMLLGASGGQAGVMYVVQRIVSVIDWGIGIDNAVSMRNIWVDGKMVDVEGEKSGSSSLIKGIKSYGHPVVFKESKGEINAVMVGRDGMITGVADSRREGYAIGR